jgi:glutamate synthase (NADPH) small chain
MALHIMDEANRCLQCKVPQCQKGCPIHTNIPLAIRLLKENKLNEAGKMLFENNPLTTVCSLVCNHENQCEGHFSFKAAFYKNGFEIPHRRFLR